MLENNSVQSDNVSKASELEFYQKLAETASDRKNRLEKLINRKFSKKWTKEKALKMKRRLESVNKYISLSVSMMSELRLNLDVGIVTH